MKLFPIYSSAKSRPLSRNKTRGKYGKVVFEGNCVKNITNGSLNGFRGNCKQLLNKIGFPLLNLYVKTLYFWSFEKKRMYILAV